MPTPPTRSTSTASIFQLKLNQRLWTRLFVQSRKLLKKVDSRFYGDAAAYEKAFQVLSPLEDARDALSLVPKPSNDILNEFTMEVAYRLTQTVHTSPMRDDPSLLLLSNDAVEDEDLLGALRNVRESLFSGGENPPHDLPTEVFSESFWKSQFDALEESTWIEFLLYMARTCFSQDESAALATRAIAHLALGRGGELAKIYDGVPSVEDIQAIQRTWTEKLPGHTSVSGGTHFQTTAKECLQHLGVDSDQADGLIRNFGAHVLGYSMNSLMQMNAETASRSFEKHEEIVESFFRESGRLDQYEKNLGVALNAKRKSWPVVLALRSTLRVPVECDALSCRILDANPAGIDLGRSTGSMRYVHFSEIEAYDPRSAIAIARRRFNAVLDGLTYTLGNSPDSHIASEAFCQVNLNDRWHWIGSGENKFYPSQILEEKNLKEWSETAAKLLYLSENNEFAARVVEALRLYRSAKETKDNQQRFTEFWLLADIFLQHTNTPEDDIPLYQLVYATAASPKFDTPGYADFQKKRWKTYRKDAEIFWEIRNHGAIHHGKAPRWEERSLGLWTLKLEKAATHVLRYCLNVSLDAAPPMSVKECLKTLRARFKAEGVI